MIAAAARDAADLALWLGRDRDIVRAVLSARSGEREIPIDRDAQSAAAVIGEHDGLGGCETGDVAAYADVG